MTIKDHLRKLSVRILKQDEFVGVGTIIQAQESYYVLTAAHVLFCKEFNDVNTISPEDIFIQFDSGETYCAESFLGCSTDWIQSDLIVIKLQDLSHHGLPISCISESIEEPGFEFIFRGAPVATGHKFKFYDGFKFDDQKAGEPHRFILHGDMKYLTDFSGISGAEMNAGVSGSGVFLNRSDYPYMVGVITDVPYENGSFGAFEASLLEPVKQVLGLPYKVPELEAIKKPKLNPNSPVMFCEDEYLKKLLVEHEREKKHDVQYKEFSDRLNKFFSKRVEKKIRNLDEKLEDGNREYLIDYAAEAKEIVSKKILSLSFYKSAQDVYTYLLSNIRSAFLHEVQSKIKSGNFENYEIDEIIKKNIIEPCLHNLSGSSMDITRDELYGILYFLTGNCYIEWD